MSEMCSVRKKKKKKNGERQQHCLCGTQVGGVALTSAGVYVGVCIVELDQFCWELIGC